MFSYHPSFAAPSYLAILLVLPLLWWYSYRRLAGLGRVRRWIALLLRTLVVVLLVMAAADLQIVRSNDHLTVLYLLDQSLSIPQGKRAAMIKYVRDEVHAHRRDKDRAGVIVFGRDAAIELPPFDDDLQMGNSIESLVDPQATNISAAMNLAQATFPEDAARRIVIVTDGNQNQGDALQQAQAAAAAGIGIDVVPIRYRVPVRRGRGARDPAQRSPPQPALRSPRRALQQLRSPAGRRSKIGRGGRSPRPIDHHENR